MKGTIFGGGGRFQSMGKKLVHAVEKHKEGPSRFNPDSTEDMSQVSRYQPKCFLMRLLTSIAYRGMESTSIRSPVLFWQAVFAICILGHLGVIQHPAH